MMELAARRVRAAVPEKLLRALTGREDETDRQ
jgi:hypothetical protein